MCQRKWHWRQFQWEKPILSSEAILPALCDLLVIKRNILQYIEHA